MEPGSYLHFILVRTFLVVFMYCFENSSNHYLFINPQFSIAIRLKCFTHTEICFSIVLLQHGADPLIRNTDGKTPLDVSTDMDVKQVLTGKAEQL